MAATDPSLSPSPTASRDPSHPPSPKLGPYFFYGSLQSPTQLRYILSLPDPPVLVPAKVYGYELKLWGPYPALFRKNATPQAKTSSLKVASSAVSFDASTATNITAPAAASALSATTASPAPTVSAPTTTIHGKLYHVRTCEHAQQLKNYETSAYRAVQCSIWVPDADGKEREVKGWTFLFVGNERDVDEGEGAWDLEEWEAKMGY